VTAAGVRRAPWLALTALTGLGLLPYVRMLGIWPVSRDATVWIVKGAPSSPGWLEWVFASSHFIGYRPVTALSYSLNYALGSFAAWPYRVTDLALHAGCALAVSVLYRRLVPALPRWGGLFASAVFLAHPLVDQVVPHLARRSYSLATLLGLVGLIVLIGRDQDRESPGWPRLVPGGLALFAAVQANEIAYLYVAIAPVLCLATGVPLRETARRWSPAVALAVVALLVRMAVVGGVGGYATAALRAERAWPIAASTWKALAWLNPVGADGAPVSFLLLGLGASVAAYYVARGVGAVRDGSPRDAAVVAALLVWLVGFAALFAPMAVWFPRQVYVALAPFALLVAVTFAATVERHRGVAFLLHAWPQVLLIGWLLFHSPVPRGGDLTDRVAARRTDAVLRDAHSRVNAAPEPSRLRLVLPNFERPRPFAFRARQGRPIPMSARQAELWLRALARDRDVAIETLAVFDEHPLEAAGPPRFRPTEGGGIVLSPDREYTLLDPRVVTRLGEQGLEILDDPAMRDGRPTSLYFHDGKLGVTIPWERP
jgi:hypothetical protein